jgi:hypothetical protein
MIVFNLLHQALKTFKEKHNFRPKPEFGTEIPSPYPSAEAGEGTEKSQESRSATSGVFYNIAIIRDPSGFFFHTISGVW